MELRELQPRDFVYGAWDRIGLFPPRVRHCLDGWIKHFVAGRGFRIGIWAHRREYERLTELVRRAGCACFGYPPQVISVVTINDLWCRFDEERAAVWNLAVKMAREEDAKREREQWIRAQRARIKKEAKDGRKSKQRAPQDALEVAGSTRYVSV